MSVQVGSIDGFILADMDIVHNPEHNRFQVALGGGALAELTYVLRPDTLTITHTFVPDAARGRGVAGRLTQAALEYARRNDLNVIPLCSFAVSYLARQRRAGPA